MNDFYDRIKALWDILKSYFHGIVTDWNEGRKPRAVWKIILPCIPLALVVGVMLLIWRNRRAILSALIVFVTVMSIIWYFADKRAARKREEAERVERVRQEAIREKARTVESTYKRMAKVVLEVSRDLGALGILPPNRLEDIYSPGRMIPVRGGEVMLGQFLLQKTGSEVDTDLLRDTMQTKVEQGLSAGKFPDICPDFIYNGRVYSGFSIDAVQDSRGFVEVYTALTDESYCRYKLDGELEKDTPSPSVDRRDMDY